MLFGGVVGELRHRLNRRERGCRGVESVLELGALDRVHARDFVVVILVGVILHAFLVELDGLPEQLETLVGIALVLALVEVGGGVTLELLLDADEVLLRVRSDLRAGASLHEFLDALPVFAEVLEGYKSKGLATRISGGI